MLIKSKNAIIVHCKKLSDSQISDFQMISSKIELVIARYNEDLLWLNDVSNEINVTVYNKGTAIDETQIQRPMTIVTIENMGREAETYARHLSERYDTLTDITVFCQGAPLEHTPDFIELIKNPSFFADVQPLGRAYRIDEMPPAPHSESKKTIHQLGEPFRLDTLETIRFPDPGSVRIRLDYLNHHGLSWSQSVVHDMMNRLLGLHLPLSTKIGRFSWGAIFGVSRTKVRKHCRSFYQRLHRVSRQFNNHAWILERCWLLIFETDFLANTDLRIVL